MYTLKLKYKDGNIFENEYGEEIALFLRAYLKPLESNQWYYCNIQNKTLYEFLEV